MALSFETIHAEASRTASPGNSKTIDLQDKGGNYVTALGSVISTAGSASSTLDVKAQWSANKADWEDIPGGAFTQVRAGFTTGNTSTPVYESIKFEAKRRYMRFVTTVAGTHVMTWRLELKYSSS